MSNEDNNREGLEPRGYDCFTLMFVVSDLCQRSDQLRRTATSGLLGSIEDGTMRARAEVLLLVANIYRDMVVKQYAEEREKAARVKATAQPKAVKRPRDFMAQAVGFGIGDGTKTAVQIRRWMIGHPKTFQLLLNREPNIEHVRDTLSAGSRGQNPRFIRVKLGWYKNNPNYKKGK